MGYASWKSKSASPAESDSASVELESPSMLTLVGRVPWGIWVKLAKKRSRLVLETKSPRSYMPRLFPGMDLPPGGILYRAAMHCGVITTSQLVRGSTLLIDSEAGLKPAALDPESFPDTSRLSLLD